MEATGDTEQTAQAGRCLLCGQKGDPDPAVWRPQKKDLAEECHNAGHNYDNTRRNEDMDPRNQPSLLERIYSWENLLDAYHEAASEKWYRNDVTAFAANLEENLISIQNDLIWHTYKVGRYRQFYKFCTFAAFRNALFQKFRVYEYPLFRKREKTILTTNFAPEQSPSRRHDILLG